jgi:hypothetical protein
MHPYDGCCGDAFLCGSFAILAGGAMGADAHRVLAMIVTEDVTEDITEESKV